MKFEDALKAMREGKKVRCLYIGYQMMLSSTYLILRNL